MSVAIDCLAAAVNCCLGNLNLSDTEALKYMAAARSLETALESVKSLDQLPNAANNTGRIIYVESIQDYRYSDGVEWVLDFTSQRYQIWSWGVNFSGRLGDGTTINRSSPVSVVGGITDWCQISSTATASHNLAIRSNGTLWSWGCNAQGRLGDGTVTARSSPVSVVGGITDWSQISAGGFHNLAIRSNGTLWSWGSNSAGQLGHNTATTCARSSPVSVVGGFTDWCRISAGYSHSLAIRANGTAWSWGCNSQGRLGDDTVTDRSSPVSVIGGITDWCRVSAGLDHSLAVRTNGTGWSWGSNSNGKLGHNTAITCCRSSPVSIVGFINWSTVSAGDQHSLGLAGEIYTWGLGTSGQLGEGGIANRSSPVLTAAPLSFGWCAISAGDCFSLGLRTNGTAWSWGSNSCGRLGDGTTINRSSPGSVVGGFTDWSQISVAGAGGTGIRLPRQ